MTQLISSHDDETLMTTDYNDDAAVIMEPKTDSQMSQTQQITKLDAAPTATEPNRAEKRCNELSVCSSRHNIAATTQRRTANIENESCTGREGSMSSCDTTSVRSSEVAAYSCRYVMLELLETEQQYVDDLSEGIARYSRIFEPESELPEGLVGQKQAVLGNVTQIANMHRHKLLPLMLEHRHDLEQLFLGWQRIIDCGAFDSYILFIAAQRESRRLYDSHELYFKHLQIKLGDPLGLRSFLMKPMQRVTRYPLLLSKFIKRFFEQRDMISRRLVELVCRLDSRLRELLERANQSEQLNDIKHFNVFSMLSEATFLMVDTFQLQDVRLRRNYNSKLYVFNTCFVYTELKGKEGKQLLRGNFILPDVCFVVNRKSFLLCNKQRECYFLCPQKLRLRKWQEMINRLLDSNNHARNTQKTQVEAVAETEGNGEGEARETAKDEEETPEILREPRVPKALSEDAYKETRTSQTIWYI